MGRNAIVIGMPNFDDPIDASSINDAEEVKKLLGTNYDGSTNFIIPETGSIESQIQFQKIVKELFSKRTDISLLYFSGHGSSDYAGGYLRMPDSDDQALGFPMEEILKLANASPAESRVIILDCCNSGAIGSSSMRFGNSSTVERGVTVLTASRHDESSKAIRGENSLFTSLMVRALDGEAADLQGNVSPGAVYAYVDKAFGPWSQRPLFMANISEYVSLRQCEPPISLQVIEDLARYFQEADDIFPLDPSFERSNHPDEFSDIKLIEPYAEADKVKVFGELQEAVKAGLVRPVDEKHMYYAAINSTGCHLTPLGKHYWDLAVKKQLR